MGEVGYKKPPVEHQFKKGQPGGPGGPKMPPEVRILRHITAQDVAEVGQLVILGDVASLEKIIKDAKHADPSKRPTVLQVWIASCAVTAIKKGDANTLNSLLDRFVGKIPAAVLVAKMDKPTQSMTPEEARDEARRLLLEVSGG